MDFEAYLSALASEAPVPGGGSAATLVVSLAAALVAMTLRVTQHDAGPERQALGYALILEADAAREAALALRLTDEAAYREVVAAGRLPKTTGADKAVRTAALQEALLGACAPPLANANVARRVAVLCDRALVLVADNANLLSDLGCAAEFAAAGLRGAAYSVRINHTYLKDPATARAQEAALQDVEREAAPALTRVRARVTAAFAR